MKQKYILVFFVSFILIITLISFFVLSNEKSKNTNNLQQDKINSKIFYLDETILNISNNINNIYLNEVDNTAQNNEINWNNIEKDVLNLYSNWDDIILELSNSNINNTSLLNFGKILDNLLISVNAKNKVLAVSNIADLYELLITYSYNTNEEIKNTIETKYYLLKSISILDTNNWNLVAENIRKAEESYYKNIGLIDSNYYNQTTKNSIYIAIKELENTISLKNKEVFLKKYKIILQKMNNTIKV